MHNSDEVLSLSTMHKGYKREKLCTTVWSMEVLYDRKLHCEVGAGTTDKQHGAELLQ